MGLWISLNYSINNNSVKYMCLRRYNIGVFWGDVDQSGRKWGKCQRIWGPLSDVRYTGYPSLLLLCFIMYVVII